MMESGSRTLASEVAEVVLHLRDIQSAVVVAAAALKHQKCELDEDIAHVLSRGVADRIQDQIERLELVSFLGGGDEPGQPGHDH
jgi:hypothetical protein